MFCKGYVKHSQLFLQFKIQAYFYCFIRGLLHMRSLVTIFLLLCSSPAFAQDHDNYIEVVANTSLYFNINTVTEMESDQTYQNAITIRMRNEDRTRNVSVSVWYASGPPGFTPTSPYPIKLDWTSDNSTNASNLITNPIQLTNTSQRLFTQAKKNNYLFTFNYDLVFMATNWSYPPTSPGHYQYLYYILFTMTNP